LHHVCQYWIEFNPIQAAVGLSLRSVQKFLAETHPYVEGGAKKEYILEKRGRNTKDRTLFRAEIASVLTSGGAVSLETIAGQHPQVCSVHPQLYLAN
jgi:hypothetical protein